MIPELLGAAQSVQTLAALLRSATSLGNYNEIVLAVSEVNSKLMQANATALESQERQAELGRKLKEVEEQLAELKSWKKEAEKLTCVQIGEGVFAYVSPVRNTSFQAQPKYCANCFLQNSPSILQESREDRRLIGLHCQRCKQKVAFTHYLNAA